MLIASKLPDRIQDFIASFPNLSQKRMSTLLTHCRRELMHEVWRLLLDKDFLHAYEHGIVIKCFDGVLRRIYPRIFTYSADYPEKCVSLITYASFANNTQRVLLATIRDSGFCPCPRCLIPKNKFDSMGLVRDISARIRQARIYFGNRILLARSFIYKHGKPITGAAVERILQPQSLVPTVVSLSF
jgi:hypothetical protein